MAAKIKKSTGNMGRPSVYPFDDPETKAKKLEDVTGMALLGLTDEDFAEFYKVAIQTWNRWKAEHEDLREALDDGRDRGLGRVAAAMAKRARGYSHPDVHITTVGTGDGCSTVVQTPITKHYAPSEAAAKLLLYNRARRHGWVESNTTTLQNPDGTALAGMVIKVDKGELPEAKDS